MKRRINRRDVPTLAPRPKPKILTHLRISESLSAGLSAAIYHCVYYVNVIIAQNLGLDCVYDYFNIRRAVGVRT